jgi:hypothetical protein
MSMDIHSLKFVIIIVLGSVTWSIKHVRPPRLNRHFALLKSSWIHSVDLDTPRAELIPALEGL